ncbi:hypothetical protein Cantr_07642 [Candida viswanathii]|uniref:Uncharacterized protein n=1 Tax=Candida viswanathii TaxID=5486 RepID=A0A367Y3J6_9ASCO|nr:hypothetical protein Cantr_07642 [Candida viswanathii]
MSTTQPITPRKVFGPLSTNNLHTTTNRKVSESTGLVKFSLSPNRQSHTHAHSTTSPTKKSITSPTRQGLTLDVPISAPQDTAQSTPTQTLQDLQLKQRELLDKYLTKQAQLHEYERLVESKKAELLAISRSIEAFKRQEVILLGRGQDVYKQAYVGTQNELSRLKIAESPRRGGGKEDGESPLKKQASFIVSQAIGECNNVKKKASLLFNNQNEELQNLMKTADQKFDLLSRQTSKFFNDNFKIFENNKKLMGSHDVANSSFNVENLDGVIYERSFDEHSLEIDIDDYDSSFE